MQIPQMPEPGLLGMMEQQQGRRRAGGRQPGRALCPTHLLWHLLLSLGNNTAAIPGQVLPGGNLAPFRGWKLRTLRSLPRASKSPPACSNWKARKGVLARVDSRRGHQHEGWGHLPQGLEPWLQLSGDKQCLRVLWHSVREGKGPQEPAWPWEHPDLWALQVRRRSSHWAWVAEFCPQPRAPSVSCHGVWNALGPSSSKGSGPPEGQLFISGNSNSSRLKAWPGGFRFRTLRSHLPRPLE